MSNNDKDKMVFEGIVQESCKGIFKVIVNGTLQIQATLSGKIKQNAVRILVGDKVKVEVSPYDTSKGRIIYRDSKKSS